MEHVMKSNPSVASRHPWLVFGLGLSVWPVVATYNGIHMWERSQPGYDIFVTLAGLVGLICCAAAPFLSSLPLRWKWMMLPIALLAYVADLVISTLASMVVFGFPG
jgi:hypothetical protein